MESGLAINTVCSFIIKTLRWWWCSMTMTQTGGDKEAEVRSGVEWSRVETAQGGGESGYTGGMLSAVIARYCLRLDTAGVTSTTTQHGTRAIVNIRARTHTRTLQPDKMSRCVWSIHETNYTHTADRAMSCSSLKPTRKRHQYRIPHCCRLERPPSHHRSSKLCPPNHSPLDPPLLSPWPHELIC